MLGPRSEFELRFGVSIGGWIKARVKGRTGPGFGKCEI